jgi:predicted amidohydrolase
MDSQLRVIVLQLQSIDHVQKNVDQVQALLEPVLREEKTALVCLPENALYMRLKEGERIGGLDLHDECFRQLALTAKEKNLAIHVGSVPLKWQGRLANSSVMVLPDGHVSASYQKIHLFDIELEGQKPVRESDVFHHGDTPSVLDFEGWKLGQTICYDLRFSELYSSYAQQGVDLILVPAAFLKKTGEAHWHVLLRARAIESQCYIIAAAQAGTHKSESGTRETYGHSLVIDPWGRVVAEASADRPECLILSLDKSGIAKVRSQIPMKMHRRLQKTNA